MFECFWLAQSSRWLISTGTSREAVQRRMCFDESPVLIEGYGVWFCSPDTKGMI